MLNELKILFENIKHFRTLLTENVGTSAIQKAINNREYLFIYYDGDDNIAKGTRTIRPYVLGMNSKTGNLLLRAWEDKGDSESFKGFGERRRPDHEYWNDDGKTVPGWRLFIVDNISRAYPTGKRFINPDGSTVIPPKYKEGSDKQMTDILAYVSTQKPERKQAGTDNISEPTVTQQQTDKSAFDVQAGKFKGFYNAGAKTRRLNKRDIEGLYNVATKVYKKSPNNYFVAVDDNGNFHLKLINIEDRFPRNANLGRLTNLYNSMVLKPTTPTSQEKQNVEKELRNMEEGE